MTRRRTFSLTALALLAVAAAPVFAQAEAGTDTPQQPPVAPANPLKTQDELRAAYQKEYAFLEAQLRDLRTRLGAFEAESRDAERKREAQIDRVEGEYIDLQARAERVDKLLAESERQISAVEDSRSTLEATFLQAPGNPGI